MQDTPFFAPETIFLFSAKIYLDIFAKIAQNNIVDDAWLSLVERCVRDAEAAGSNPVASTLGRGARRPVDACSAPTGTECRAGNRLDKGFPVLFIFFSSLSIFFSFFSIFY